MSCIICGGTLVRGITSVVKRKGLQGLLRASIERQDGKEFPDSGDVTVHLECRIEYTRPSAISAAKSLLKNGSDDINNNSATLRSCCKPFNLVRDCIFCGKEASVKIETKKEKKYRKTVVEVHTVEFKDTIIEKCNERGDSWGEIVRRRVDIPGDLHAKDAKYHDQCRSLFFIGADLEYDGNESKRVGRPEDGMRAQVFNRVCQYIETAEDCQFSLHEIESYMESVSLEVGCEPYCRKSLRDKLLDRYGNHISITTLPGKNNVVNFKGTSDNILYENWYNDRKISEQDERQRIVDKAAEIILEDIRGMPKDCDNYPDAEELSVSNVVVPASLTSFLSKIISAKDPEDLSVKRKRHALAEAIVSACRPRSFLSPVLLGVGVYVHRHYGSRQLVDMLSALGLSVSYGEVLRYEKSVIAQETVSNDHGAGEYTQYVFDNVDCNMRTLNGHNTFHSLGGVRCTTPAPARTPQQVRRLPAGVPVADITKGKGFINISWYRKPAEEGLRKVKVEELTPSSVQTLVDVKKAESINTLWLCGTWTGVKNSPSWSGFMRSAMSSDGDFECSQVEPLPFINLSPSNPSAIYSALLYASEECNRRGQKICFVTCDQALYSKAAAILPSVQPGLLGIIKLRLGGFHSLMNFMGAIGHIMGGSGIEDLWGEVYAKASVVHMMTGHAYTRALRAHFMTQHAIGTLVLEKCADLDTATATRLSELHSRFLTGDCCEQEIVGDPDFALLSVSFEKTERIVENGSHCSTVDTVLQDGAADAAFYPGRAHRKLEPSSPLHEGNATILSRWWAI